ncbi:High-affinity methionine permease [Fusarium oxysporum f. sp. albedinis]|nr:High-affinity methionine permease [Fusarium oxysporum f. sp. albedinis]
MLVMIRYLVILHEPDSSTFVSIVARHFSRMPILLACKMLLFRISPEILEVTPLSLPFKTHDTAFADAANGIFRFALDTVLSNFVVQVYLQKGTN